MAGGGDVPGLNAVIKTVTYRSSENNIEVIGLRCGWEALTHLNVDNPESRRHEVQEYGEADAYGHRKKASVAESLADEIRRRTGEETLTSDLTYDLRSGEPDFVDKLVGLTFGNMAYDAILEGKTGLMSALVGGRYELMPIPDAKLGPRKVDVATAYNIERYRPMYANKLGMPVFLNRAS